MTPPTATPLTAPRLWCEGDWRGMLPDVFATTPMPGPDVGPDDPATLRSSGTVHRATMAFWVNTLTAAAIAITADPAARHPMPPDDFRHWLETTPLPVGRQAAAILAAWHPAAWAACSSHVAAPHPPSPLQLTEQTPPVRTAALNGPRVVQSSASADAAPLPAITDRVPSQDQGSDSGPVSSLAGHLDAGDTVAASAALRALLALPAEDLAAATLAIQKHHLLRLSEILGNDPRPDPVLLLKALNGLPLSADALSRRALIVSALAIPPEARPQTLLALLKHEAACNRHRPLTVHQFWIALLARHPLPDDMPFRRDSAEGFGPAQTLGSACQAVAAAAHRARVRHRERHRTNRP